MKQLRKKICLVLIFVLLIGIIPAQAQEVQERHEVTLLLDLSGSMDGEPIQNVKEASKKFAEKAIALPNTFIRIVGFSSEVYEIVDFSNELDLVNTEIDNIGVYGMTNISVGLENIINRDEGNAKKTLVVFSDGMPNEGAYSYEEGELKAENYQNNSYIGYCNAAIDLAKKLRGELNYKIFALGYFEHIWEGEKPLAIDFMKALAGGNYLDIKTVEDIDVIFEDAAGLITSTDNPIIIVPGIMGSRLYIPEDVNGVYNVKTNLLEIDSSDQLISTPSFWKTKKIWEPEPKLMIEASFDTIKYALEQQFDFVKGKDYSWIAHVNNDNITANEFNILKTKLDQTNLDLLKTLMDGSRLRDINEESLKPVDLGSLSLDKLTVQSPAYGAMNTYENLVKKLIEKYDGDRNIYVFSYDWRQDNFKTAQYLEGYIEKVLAETKHSKVDIIAHSMGGLVVSSLSKNARDKVENYASMGTPYLGSARTIYSFETNQWMKAFEQKQGALGYIGSRSGFILEQSYLTWLLGNATASFPSVAQLLPSIVSLYNEPSYEFAAGNFFGWRATLSVLVEDNKNYNLAASERKLFDLHEYHYINENNEDTLKALRTQFTNNLRLRQLTSTQYENRIRDLFNAIGNSNNYQNQLYFRYTGLDQENYTSPISQFDRIFLGTGYGIPTIKSFVYNENLYKIHDIIFTTRGDGTVTQQSAQFDPSRKLFDFANNPNVTYCQYAKDHGEIIKDHKPINDLIDFLDKGKLNNSIVQNGNYVVIKIRCPLEVKVEQDGEVLDSRAVFSQQGGYDETSFGSLYRIGEDFDEKIIAVQEGKYQLNMEGIDVGNATISIERYNCDDEIDAFGVVEEIPIIKGTNINIDLNETKAELSYDYDGNGIVEDTLTIEGIQVVELNSYEKLVSETKKNAPSSNTGVSITKKPTTSDKIEVAKGKEIQRIAGANRYETAVMVSKEAFNTADTVVIASGENYPDALSAVVLAKRYNSPILLTRSGSLPEVVQAELTRLGAKKLLVVGGENSVSTESLQATGLTIERIAGNNRYDTAKLVLQEAINAGSVNGLIIASGKGFPDALAVGSYAARENMPILLVGDSLSGENIEWIKSSGIKNVLIAGGVNTVAKSIEEDLIAAGLSVERVAGENRYETSAAIARKFGTGATTFVLATGADYPDALSAGPLAYKLNAPILLTDKTTLPQCIQTLLSEGAFVKGVLVGGPNSISDAVQEQLKK